MPKLVSAAARVRLNVARGASIAVRRSLTVRIIVAIIAGTVAGAAFSLVSRPAATVATPPYVAVPLTTADVRTDLRVGQAPNAEIDIAFTAPMSEASVAAALTVAPQAAVDLRWNAAHTLLAVTPQGTWDAGTFHTITIRPGALGTNGQPMTTAVRAAFLVREATTATIVPTAPIRGGVGVDTAFEIRFARPVDGTTLSDALSIEPATPVALRRIGHRDDTRFVFVPTRRLAPGTTYTVVLAPTVRDAAGGTVVARALTVATTSAPSIVRFRPSSGSSAIARDATISVRFTEPMDVASTGAAFVAKAGSTRLAGTIHFAEDDTVLVFAPRTPLAAGQRIDVSVRAGARSRKGVPIAAPASISFTTAGATAPQTPPPRTPVGTPVPTSKPPSAGSGSWAAVEAYYLTLMNCTRTGGWVTSTGACSSPGGRAVAPLRLDATISSRVSRPYAKLLATRGQCDHFIGGTPGNRLSRVGFTSYIWAENLGCRSGNPYSAVLGSHLFFQNEKPYLGGHYVNLMNAKYDRVGIGVWVASGRVRLVVDFYHPR
ncbi:MAG TPA: Ig-like domain-containing protein [Candidatus Limnocylindrales bacterium]